LTLQKIHEREDNALHSYKVIDAEKGIYQIPITRVIELVVDEANKNSKLPAR